MSRLRRRIPKAAAARADRHAKWVSDINGPGGDNQYTRRFVDTTYTCSATDFESHQLWERYHCILGIQWHPHSVGAARQIGSVTTDPHTFPIMANVNFADVCGKHLVAFVSSSSQVTDHSLLQEWRETVFPNVRDHRDPANFSALIHDMAKVDGVGNYFARKIALVDVLDDSRDGLLPTLETLFPEMSLLDRFSFAERKMQAWGERARAYQTTLEAGFHK